jgi:hypothetical protein
MRLLITALAALALAPTAFADGPSYITQGWAGVAAPRGTRYVTVPAGRDTVLEQIHRDGGRVENFATLPGSWGIPAPTIRGTGAGLTRDGKLLVLGDASMPSAPLRARSRFALVATKTLQPWTTIDLRGDFGFDALSPDGKTLFLIQHLGSDASRYVVRAYDLEHLRLLPGRIADVRQRGWLMAGVPVARATSRDGRFVYTLYRRDGGTPFVHVLDAVRRTAVCAGVPWPAAKSQDELFNAAVRLDGARLTIATRSAKLVLDTATDRFVQPDGGSGPGWIVWVFVGVAAAAAAAGLTWAAAARRWSLRPAWT